MFHYQDSGGDFSCLPEILLQETPVTLVRLKYTLRFLTTSHQYAISSFHPWHGPLSASLYILHPPSHQFRPTSRAAIHYSQNLSPVLYLY